MTRPNAILTEACISTQGRIYSKQGPVQKKMWGPSPGAADSIFPGKNWRPFLVITVLVLAVSSAEKLASFFGHHCRFYSFHSFLGCRPLFPACQKIYRSSCGGLCSAEHAEHA